MPSLAEKFIAQAMPEPNTGCWIWCGRLAVSGYGTIYNEGKNVLAHRVSYEISKGKIPDGLHVDHRCSNRWCVNPDHLDAVTQAENGRRTAQRGRCKSHNSLKTHCPYGHPYSGDNLYTKPNGERVCVTCRNDAQRKKYKSHGIANSNKTHCSRGHPFSPENTTYKAGGWRRCRTCHRENEHNRLRRRKERGEVA